MRIVFKREIPVYGWQVIHTGLGSQVFHQPVSGFVSYELTKAKCFSTIGYRIFVDVAKHENAIGAGRYTVGQASFSNHIGAEIAFTYGSFFLRHTGFAGIRFIGNLFFQCGLFPIENPCGIRAGSHAEPASNATIAINEHNAILPFESSVYRANFYTGRLITVHTGSGLPVRCGSS